MVWKDKTSSHVFIAKITTKRLTATLSMNSATYFNNSVDILSSVETHEVHWQHLEAVCPVLKLLNLILQIQPEGEMNDTKTSPVLTYL